MLTKFTIGITILLSVSANARTVSDIVFPNMTQSYQACTTNDNLNGGCRNYTDCPSKLLSGANKFPKICGFNHGSKTPVICCPATLALIKTNKTGSINLKQVEAPITTFDCGHQGIVKNTFALELKPTTCFTSNKIEDGSKILLVKNPILTRTSILTIDKEIAILPINEEFEPQATVGGINADRASWPWMALLGRNNGDSVNYFCDGVLINEQFILTAAHCLLDGEQFFIRLGEHNFKIGSSATPFNVEFEKLDIYPEYKLNQGHHDLALIKLTQKVTIKNDVRPVCLPWGTPANIDLLGKCVTVTGWGASRFGGRSTPHLQEVNVEVFDSTDCHKSYSSLSNFDSTFPDGMNFENILCAGDKEGGKDACQGDSGGPLVHFEDGKWFLGGIISKGYGCGHPDFPGLYAPIRNLDYLQWIKDIAFS